MKAKWFVVLLMMAIQQLLAPAVALTPSILGDVTQKYIFIENNSDDNFFVTPATGIVNPRISGSNRWTGLKYTGSGPIYQQSLGYIDNGLNKVTGRNYKFDMWLEESPISHPLLGQRCINWYSGCNMDTSLILPQVTDVNGFYGVTTPSSATHWQHGMMADSFYQYLQQVTVGSAFSMKVNTCQTPIKYDATTGARCKDQTSGVWQIRKITATKVGHMSLINTGSLAEVYINSDGVATLGEGNIDCQEQIIGKLSGISCKMVSYTLQHNGINNASIHIFPAINNSALSSTIVPADMQFSLDRNKWKFVNGIANFYTFNDLKTSSDIYVFFSQNFFKQMVKLGITDINTRDLFNFRFQNTVAPEAGWYEFSTSNTLIIKPQDFSVSIISDDFAESPSREGDVGNGKPALDFNYIVTTSGKTAADEVLIKASGPEQSISGRSYCLFSSTDGVTKVPFPATLTFTTKIGTTQTYDAGCNNTWRDMTDALWLSTPWSGNSGESGIMNKSTVRFSILMNDKISQRTLDNDEWFGEVSASGEIHVQATWRNVN